MARAYNQARKFGVEMPIPDEVIGLEAPDDRDNGRFILRLSNNERVSARSVVIASGARYRQLAVVDIDEDTAVECGQSSDPSILRG